MPHDRPTTLLVFLAGSRRGSTVELAGDELRIGSGAGMDVRLPSDGKPAPAPHHATLRRRGRSYEIEAVGNARVWVNGEPTRRLVLASGDVVELGGDSAVLRYRLYPTGAAPRRSLSEVFSDCLECANRASGSLPGRAVAVTRQLPRDLASHMPPAVRAIAALLLLLIAGFAATSWVLVDRTRAVEVRLAELSDEAAGAEIAVAAERSRLDSGTVAVLLAELQAEIASATTRIDSLQEQAAGFADAIRVASAATVFVQGAYRFRDPVSGQPVRVALDPSGQPVTDAAGLPLLSSSSLGPAFESLYTGTGFVAAPRGLIVTNRHVALPWEFDGTALRLVERGLVPYMHRLIGYLPRRDRSFELVLVEISDEADIAVLRADLGPTVPHLRLAEDPVVPGDEVAVLGYPLGIRALMARAGAPFVQEMRRRPATGFWEVASGLAERGLITPLATLGIVGQRSTEFIAYDAETTSGGSGGPVLRRDGRVVAVNAAIMPEFGGSNLGVPIDRVADLLRRVARQ